MSMARRIHVAMACLIALAMGIGELPLITTAAAAATPAENTPAPAKPTAKTGGSHAAKAKTNPHVHQPPLPPGAKSTSAKKMTSKPLTPQSQKHHKRSRTQHRSGVVTGVIHDSRGGNVSGARVRLMKGWRRHRRTHHVGVTTAQGHYVFRGVGAGRFRVFASRTGTGSGHARFAIKGGVKHVDVKLGGGGGKKKKHKKR